MTSVAHIEGMDRGALLALWSEVLGGAPPRSMSQPLMRRLLAWEVQAKVQGGLPSSVRAKLDSLSAAQAKGTVRSPTPKLKPGGRFLRQWNGVTHVVDVVEGGYLWRGERHRSLSAIARAITGAHWSGPRFFGLQDAPAGGTASRGMTLSNKAAEGTLPSNKPSSKAKARRAAVAPSATSGLTSTPTRSRWSAA